MSEVTLYLTLALLGLSLAALNMVVKHFAQAVLAHLKAIRRALDDLNHEAEMASKDRRRTERDRRAVR